VGELAFGKKNFIASRQVLRPFPEDAALSKKHTKRKYPTVPRDFPRIFSVAISFFIG
jgi:hypothetical protein